MKGLMSATIFTVSLGLLTPALADSDAGCGDTPRDQWMSEDAVSAQLRTAGYEVRRVKTEDACYEAYVVDSKGARLEVKINPATGEIVDTEGDD